MAAAGEASERDPAWPGPAPDYADHERAWAAFPGVREVTAAGVRDAGAPPQDADCFFLHASTFFSKFEKRPNAKFSVPLAGSDFADDSNCLFHAAAFAGSCRLYVPRYRQAEFGAYTTKDVGAARRTMELAYGDTRRALQYYLDRCSGGRPFFLAGHSQGSAHALRLLFDVIDGTAAAKRCVAAYLPGQDFPLSAVERLRDFRASMAPEQVHAVACWNAAARRGAHGNDRLFDLLARNPSIPQMGPGYWLGESYGFEWGPRLSTSPLTWRSSIGGGGGAQLHLGVATASFDPPDAPVYDTKFRVRLARVRRSHPGTLSCTTTAYEVVVDGMDRELGERNAPMWQKLGRLHQLNYSLFWYNVRDNVAERLAAYRRLRRASKL